MFEVLEGWLFRKEEECWRDLFFFILVSRVQPKGDYFLPNPRWKPTIGPTSFEVVIDGGIILEVKRDDWWLEAIRSWSESNECLCLLEMKKLLLYGRNKNNITNKAGGWGHSYTLDIVQISSRRMQETL